ncbi:MAG: hypothetical protein ACI9FR_001154 [Cryomorphaceae bacterium]|jgi:hypothetical protein
MELAAPGNFIRLQKGQVFTNFGFAMHPSLVERYAKKLKEFLQGESIYSLLRPMYQQTASKTYLVTASIDDYPFSYTQPLATYWRGKSADNANQSLANRVAHQ